MSETKLIELCEQRGISHYKIIELIESVKRIHKAFPKTNLSNMFGLVCVLVIRCESADYAVSKMKQLCGYRR